jgi:hypothetical protein
VVSEPAALPTRQLPIERKFTASPAPPPESESDDPNAAIAKGQGCRRRGCKESYDPEVNRDTEECTYHPGAPIFHEGSKGYSCCKRRVLEFDEFMKIEGCKTKKRHLFVGSGKKKSEEENLTTVRYVGLFKHDAS